MTKIAAPKVALSLKVYGFELHLWKEDVEREWGASLRNKDVVASCNFEEDSLTLAKLHLLGEARNRAIQQSGNSNLPGCDAYLNSWKPINLSKQQ